MNINISSFEVAKLFGLQYIGECEYADIWGETDWAYDFEFHGKSIRVKSGYGDEDASDEQEAKEEAAKQVLLMIGKASAMEQQ